jgi:hypothetical protein
MMNSETNRITVVEFYEKIGFYNFSDYFRAGQDEFYVDSAE